MVSDRLLRGALWTAAVVNSLGVLVFGAAALGRSWFPLPQPLPALWAAQLTLVIAIFGVVYAALAIQQTVNRQLLLVGAVGKIGFFGVFSLFWTAGDLPAGAVVQASPDLILGAVFLWYLSAVPRTPAA